MDPKSAPRKWEAWQILALALAALVVIGVPVVATLNRKPLPPDEYFPATLLGNPLRLASASGDRLYFLAEQKRRYWYWYSGRSSLSARQVSREAWHIELWAIDTADGQVAWRRRFEDNGTDAMSRHSELLSAEGAVLRVGLRRPLRVSATDGKPLDAPAGEVLPLRGAQVYDAYGTLTRGWRSEDGARWLGLLTDEELEKVGRDPRWTPESLAVPPVAGEAWLHAAGVSRVSAAPPDWPAGLGGQWGERNAYRNYRRMTASPAFRQAGLLVAEARGPAIPMRDPAGSLLLHRPDADPRGPLRLARIDAANGAVLWDVPLPQRRLDHVLAGEDRLLLSGETPVANGGEGAVPERWFSSIPYSTGVAVHFELGALSRVPAPDPDRSP